MPQQSGYRCSVVSGLWRLPLPPWRRECFCMFRPAAPLVGTTHGASSTTRGRPIATTALRRIVCKRSRAAREVFATSARGLAHRHPRRRLNQRSANAARNNVKVPVAVAALIYHSAICHEAGPFPLRAAKIFAVSIHNGRRRLRSRRMPSRDRSAKLDVSSPHRETDQQKESGAGNGGDRVQPVNVCRAFIVTGHKRRQ